MRKRRFEIAALAALIALGAMERPSIDVAPKMIQVADLAPQRIETVRDLGLIAVKLAVTWID